MFPKLLQRLFANEGAGPKLRADIIPDSAIVKPATATPKDAGTAAVGTSPKYAREDHRHPLQTSVSGSSGSCTGNAATATKLATARTILVNLGVTTAASFDGSANATPGVSGTLPVARGGTGRTDGKAIALATARAIDGVDFDGSAAVTHYATCSTAAATAAKVVSLAGFTLVTGAKVTVRFAVTNTAANPTLNVNGTGAKAIQYRNAAITAGALAANRTYEFVYDGSSWELVGDLDSNTTYTAASAAPKAAGTAAVGTSVKYAREDHVHPAQTSVSGSSGSCTGNAATATTATKLAAARTISLSGDATGSVKFDGSANAAIAATIVGLVPVGGIVAFSGTFSGRNPVDMKSKKAMTGWCLCDGTATNGLAVPDLRDRMIMGAGTTYKTGSKGGAATHTHSVSGTVGATTLTEKQLAAHKHTQSTEGDDMEGDLALSQRAWESPVLHTKYGGATYNSGSSAPHAHSLSGVKSGSASSLPPYYALAYIMRCA